jgi:hypothetical protein
MLEVGQPVIVDVNIDYSKRTRFTQGVAKTVLKHFPSGDRFRPKLSPCRIVSSALGLFSGFAALGGCSRIPDAGLKERIIKPLHTWSNEGQEQNG